MLDRYNCSLFTLPYWKGNTIYHESLTFIKYGENRPQARLLFTPENVITCRSSSLEIEYKSGVDYIIKDDIVILPEGSNIPYLTEEELYTNTGGLPDRSGTKRIYHFENGELIKRQVAISYSHKDLWK